MSKVFQKPIAGILILLICFSLTGVLLYPKKAWAVSCTIVADPYTLAQTVADVAAWIKNAASWVKDYAFKVAKWAWEKRGEAMDVAAAYFRKKLMDKIVNEIVEWIQGNGDPSFVTDWKGFLTDAADEAGADVLESILGKDVMDALCDPNWAVKINIALKSPQTFEESTQCTLSDIGANYDDFMDNFHNGGWESWIKVSESQNNPYGLYLTVLDEKLTKEAEAKEAAANRASAGSGFLSDRVCKKMDCGDFTGAQTGTFKENDIPDGCYCETWETRTPGKILGDTLQEGLLKDIKWLENNEQWQSYMVAIADALINRLVTEGIGAITSDDISGGSVFDPTNTDFCETCEETYGEDSEFCDDYCNYDDPIDEPDDCETCEDIYGEDSEYCDEYCGDDPGDTTPPVTAALLNRGWDESESKDINYWKITLTANETSDIYYTTNGTEPTTSSSLYSSVFKIKIEETTTFKWFGMDEAENKEDIQTLEITVSDDSNDANAPITKISLERDSDTNYWEITLTADKAKADIYYTTDETDPKNSDSSMTYAEPIEIVTSTTLKWFSQTTAGDSTPTETTQIISFTVNSGNGNGTITGVSFDWSTAMKKAKGSDNFPMTWADDNNQYTAWGDGYGFKMSDTKKSLGVSKVMGDFDNQSYSDLWSGSGKSYGIISVSGVLYMWVGWSGTPGLDNNSGTDAWERSQLYKSTDHGSSWTAASWYFTKSDKIFAPTFLQMGKDYEDNEDGYVYTYAPVIQTDNWQVQKPGEIILMRVPKGEIMNESSYKFYAGNGSWTSSYSSRQPCLSNSDGVMQTSVIYIKGLKTYVLMTEHTSFTSGNLHMYQSKTPYGPWTEFYQTSSFSAKSFFWNIAPKWVSEDGKSFVLVYTGTGDGVEDYYLAVKGTFTTE